MTDDHGSGGPGGTGADEEGTEQGGYEAIRSFVVRALLERDERRFSWRGYLTDVSTGQRQSWSSVDEIGRLIHSRLAPVDPRRGAEPLMAAPTMGIVIDEMLRPLRERLSLDGGPLPEPNVTVQRVKESLVGLGGLRGFGSAGSLGVRALQGVRLDARVRFQLWGLTAEEVDDAVVALHSSMLDREALRDEGFLKVAAAETSVAEPVDVVNGWRKTTSYDVLFECQYEDSDDASSLIARIPTETDLETTGANRESETVRDDLARWDDEGASPLELVGPFSVGRLEVLSFIPSPPLAGTLSLLRTTSDADSPPSQVADLASFLGAVSGDQPSDTNVELTLAPGDFLAELTPLGDNVELGDWDRDDTPDSFEPLGLTLSPALHLPRPSDRFSIGYSTPDGLGQPAVLYLRVNPP